MTGDKNKNLELQPIQCFQLFDQSFRRMKYFACISDNIEADNLPAEWIIKNDSGVSYGMKVPFGEDKENIIQAFRHYLRMYLARDCMEAFALCLDELCFMLLLISKGKRKIKSNQTLYDVLSDDEKEFLRTFRAKGVSPKDGKVRLLNKKFNLEISNDNKKIISGLKDIRDCLTHRNGIVGERDGAQTKDEKREFRWSTFEVFIVDGKTKKQSPIEVGRIYKNGGDIYMRIANHSKLFNIGERLTFSSVEVYEIAQSLQLVIQEYLRQINKKFDSNSK